MDACVDVITMMMLGGNVGAWGRSDGLHREVGKVFGIRAARRLGQRIPMKNPPSPVPNKNTGVVLPLTPPPPSLINKQVLEVRGTGMPW